MNTVAKQLSILLYPAEDMKDTWIGHCLELDVISQGNSAEHAYAMVLEAVALSVEDDRLSGHMRTSAPKEYWNKFHSAIEKEKT